MMKMFLVCVLASLASVASAITADLVLEQKDGRLVAKIAIKGCTTSGHVTVEWTSPNEEFFQSTTYKAPYRSCAKGAGTARTSAYRTLWYKYQTESCGEQIARATGTWTVRVLNGDDVLASAEYTVEKVRVCQ